MSFSPPPFESLNLEAYEIVLYDSALRLALLETRNSTTRRDREGLNFAPPACQCANFGSDVDLWKGRINANFHRSGSEFIFTQVMPAFSFLPISAEARDFSALSTTSFVVY